MEEWIKFFKFISFTLGVSNLAEKFSMCHDMVYYYIVSGDLEVLSKDLLNSFAEVSVVGSVHSLGNEIFIALEFENNF